MPSYIELDKQSSFPPSSNSGKVILGINNSNQLQATNSDGQSIGVTGLPYKVYTALLTQSGGDVPNNQGSGAVTKGVTYTVDEYFADTDLSNVGGGTFASPISPFVATSNDTPINYNGSALYFNEGAPVVTVLENSIGNIWWTYNYQGSYSVQSDALFLPNKTFFTTGPANSGDNPAQNTSEYTFNTDSSISILTFYDGSLFDNRLLNTAFEIRVYN